MLIIDFSQRDVLSIATDVVSLLGWITVGGYFVIKLSRKTESSRSESSARIKKKTDKRTGRDIFGRPYSRESEELVGSAEGLKYLQKAQTEREVKKKNKERNNK